MRAGEDPRRSLPAKGKGCKTCRIRRIKCDKAFPVCVKCSSTGRKCDGYGLWGGGSRVNPASELPTKSVLVARIERIADVQHISSLALPIVDQEGLEWFQFRTVRKTPGMFKSEFWDTLLLQASATEPAIMHGVLALSDVHRCGVSLEIQSGLSKGTAGRLWTSGLQHYVEAISHLRRRTSFKGTQDTMDFRITIITCMVFICVELLRGQIDSAQSHLRGGMGILRQAGWLRKHGDPTLGISKSSSTVDRRIIEVLGRFHLHDETFNLFFLNRTFDTGVPLERFEATFTQPELPSGFTYMDDAWASADRLLLASIYLVQDSKAMLMAGRDPASNRLLGDRQRHLGANLDQWSKSFERSASARFKVARGANDESPALIQIAHITATILVETALFVDDEMIYDRHTGAFRRLLHCTAQMLRIYQEQSKLKTAGEETAMLMSLTIFDICTLPVLYFVATRCRVISIRRQALAGLSVLRHRECHWDGWLTYTVAKRVVELKENQSEDGGRPGVKLDDVVPTCSRLWNQRILTAGDPFTKLSLEFERKDPGPVAISSRRTVLDIRSGVWSPEASIHADSVAVHSSPS